MYCYLELFEYPTRNHPRNLAISPFSSVFLPYICKTYAIITLDANDLEVEIYKISQMSISVFPDVGGAFGLIRKYSHRYFKVVYGSPCLKEIQKIFLTSASHRVLSV